MSLAWALRGRSEMDRIEEVVTKTLESTPHGATHWSTRQMAKKLGFSQTSIRRIGRAFGRKPHRSETFVLAKDPQLVAKVRQIVGLYLSPPTNALVWCVDEKSQLQALSRSQPILPMSPGALERRTPDYFRARHHPSFCGLGDRATGKVIGRCFAKHRSQEFRAFLELVEESVPSGQEVHLVLDNYATHKTARVQRWLLQQPRYHLPFTPAHASWLKSSGTLVGLAHSAADQTRQPLPGRFAHRCYRRLHHHSQRESQAPTLAKNGG